MCARAHTHSPLPPSICLHVRGDSCGVIKNVCERRNIRKRKNNNRVFFINEIIGTQAVCRFKFRRTSIYCLFIVSPPPPALQLSSYCNRNRTSPSCFLRQFVPRTQRGRDPADMSVKINGGACMAP